MGKWSLRASELTTTTLQMAPTTDARAENEKQSLTPEKNDQTTKPNAEDQPYAPDQACAVCRLKMWWQRPDGGWVCGICHPDPELLRAEWVLRRISTVELHP